jgi:hypothetical protein
MSTDTASRMANCGGQQKHHTRPCRALVGYGIDPPRANQHCPCLSGHSDRPIAQLLPSGRPPNRMGKGSRSGGEGARPGGVIFLSDCRIFHGVLRLVEV